MFDFVFCVSLILMYFSFLFVCLFVCLLVQHNPTSNLGRISKVVLIGFYILVKPGGKPFASLLLFLVFLIISCFFL